MGWRNMLQNRRPLYNRKFNNPTLVELQRKNLYRNQYQTRRDAFHQLARVNELYREGNLEKLVPYVENIMSNFYSEKSTTVFPRKFEFTNEVYNLLALTYLKQLQIPPHLYSLPLQEQLHRLLDVPLEDRTKAEVYRFGEKSTFKDPTAPDFTYIKLKRAGDKLEARAEFAHWAIERCYLCHERAKLNLKMMRLDETRSLARKIISDEGEKSKNWVWKFLGSLMLLRANTLLNNVERNAIEVKETIIIAKRLNERCLHFAKNLESIIRQMSEAKKISKE